MTIRPTIVLLLLLPGLAWKLAAAQELEDVQLGDPSLTAGIADADRVTLDELRRWLADADNHQPLRPIPPRGQYSGDSLIVGLEENPMTRAKIELGRQLFFDKRLSRDETISCASCHQPANSYTDARATAIGIDDQVGHRNSPTAINRLFSTAQFHDGRAASLEEQAIGPIENPIEMGFTHEETVARLAKVPGYQMQFEKLFDEGLTIETVGKALATFERTLVSGTSPWDYYARLRSFQDAYSEDLADRELLKEEDPDLAETYDRLLMNVATHPISPAAKRGGKLFYGGRLNCTTCHAGSNFTDEEFHNIGVGLDRESNHDVGRIEVTKDQEDHGAFKTPTLRNVALTAPYMHDGSIASLTEVVEWYVKGGHANPQLSEHIEPLKLTDQEKSDLVAFLESLTGDLPSVNEGSLPE